ncbi:MAG: beta strand repeat-containing protein [Bacteroidia bacterium]
MTNAVTTANGLVILDTLNGVDVASKLINSTNAMLQYRGVAVPFFGAGSLDAATNINTVNYSGAAQGLLGTTYRTLLISGSSTKTANGSNCIVQDQLTINAGLNLTLTNGNFTLNGALTLNGTLTDNNAAGTNIFNTPVTINLGATLSSTAAVAANFEFANGITANGTLNIAAAATSLFRTNNQNISGTGATISLGNVTVGSGITLTNNVTTAGGLILKGNLNGTDAGSVLVNGANALLQYQGTATPFATAGSLDAATNANTVNYSLNGAQGVLGTTYRTLIVSAGNTKTVNASDLTVQTQLTINTFITLLLTSGNFTLNGALTLNGILTDNNAAGTNIFNTPVTINSAATLSSSAVAANFEFHNGITATGTLNLATASVSTFKTTNQIIGGTSATVQLGAVIIDSDIELTNDVNNANGLVIKGNLDGANTISEFINASGRLLNYQGVQKPMLTSGLFTVDINPNTVRYSGATQTIADVSYFNLEITAAGTKNISDVRINGNYSLTAGTIVSTGVMNFEGALAATMQNNGAPTYQEVLINKPGSTLTLTSTAAANFTVNNLTVAAGSLVFGNAFVRSITVNGTLSGAGALDMSGSTHTLTLLGLDNVIGSLITDANLSRVNYNRSGDQNVFASQNYRGLTVAGTGLKVLGGQVRVNSNLNMGGAAGCLISLGNNDLKISSGATLTGTFDATRYILTNGTGFLVKESTTTGEFTTNMTIASVAGTYPVGSGGFYTPFTINALTATVTGTGAIFVRAVPTRQPNVPYFNNALVKHWDVETANLAVTSSNLRFAFNSGEVIGLVGNYVPRVWNGTALVTPATPSAPGSNPFTTTGSTFIAGEWTAIDPTIRSSLYSYQSGDWFNPNTWTTDPSGNTLVSPMVPGNGDQVVILNGRTVTLTASNDTVGSLTINAGAILDLAATTGHSFGPIAGEGRMRLRTTTLPTGNYTAFVAATGGTIEYYDLASTPATLSTTQATYNNLDITNSLGTPTNLIQGSNITLNGNLNIINTGASTCTFTVGDVATNRTLTISKNVTLSAGANWFVGTAGGTHSITIVGSLTNSGTLDFTNGADYTAAANGRANVFFSGNNENTAINANTGSSTTFYGFTTTKAFGYELAVNVAPGAPMNFVDAGQAFTIGGNGTFRLGPNITSPRIGGGGNYDLGATGFRPTLWIDGATVTDGNVGGAIVPYGTLKITSGTLNCINGQGSVVLRESGVLQIEGGTVNMRIFRTSVTAITHRGAFIMSGGTLNISGDNGSEGGYYAMFSLPYPENVFQMSGGTINITRTVPGGITTRGGLMIGSNDQSYIVTGGTINASITAAQDFDIASTAPFYNFNVSKTGAVAGKMTLSSINWSFDGNVANTTTNAAQPLRILNDLNLNSTGSPVFDAADQNVIVGGNFTIASGAEMRNGNNVLVFNGAANQTFTLNGAATFSQGGGSSFISGSEDIQTGVNWTLEGLTSSVNIESDPNSLFTAERILEAAGTSAHRLYSNLIPTSGPTTASIFVKPAGRTCVGLYVGDFANMAIARYNLTGAGSVTFTNGNVTGSSITAEANGWYRISITSLGVATYRMRVYLLDAGCVNDTYAGNTSLGIAMWGAKLESGSTPTPYVSSTGLGMSSLQVSKTEGTILQLAGSASSFNFVGNARILTGNVNLGTKTLNVGGAVTHNTQISGSAGSKLRLNGTLVQSMAGDGDATIQNLTLDNSGGSAGSTQVAMLSDFTIENQLELVSNRVFSIENNRLNLPLTATIVATSGAFSATKFIRTNGFLSDRGISKTFGTGATSFVFPFGTPGNYTPATLNFTSAPTSWGTLDIRPVAARQLYVTDSNCFELYWRINSTGFSGIPANSLNFTFNYGNLPDNTTYIPAFYNFQTIAYTTINNVNAVDEATNNISFNSFSNLNGDFTAGNPAAFGIVTPYYSRTNGSWNTPSTWSNDIVATHNGVPSSTIPSGNSPVFVGNGTTAFHTITVPSSNTISGSLIVDAGSTLDLGATTGNNFGALPYATAGGAGKVRIAGSGGNAEFPAGDFGLFFTQTGGTTEYYTTSGGFTLPNVTAAPTSMNINTYRNLMLSPSGTNTITFPDRDLTIYENLTVGGSTVTAQVNLSDVSPRILTINGNLALNGGTLSFPATFNQEVLVNGNLIVAAGAELNSAASGTALHTLKLYGNLTNNGTLDLNNSSDVAVQMLGTTAANITGTNASAYTDFYGLSINKGTNSSLVVNCDISGTLDATENNWLNIQNGTFRFSKGGSITINSAANSTFLIPETGRLSVNHPSAVVNTCMSNTGGSDVIVAGELEIIDGTVNVGDASNNQHNDLEYASTGAPSIKVQNNGVLNVNGQIRRSVFSVIGSLNYLQSGNSTVLVRGKNPDAAGSFNSFRGKFEILNPGSSFAMSGNALLIIDRAGLANAAGAYGDVYLTPETSTISGGEVRIGTSNTASATVFDMTSTAPFWNLTVDGTITSKTLNNNTNATSILNDLTIGGNSIFKANGFNVSIGGTLINQNSNATAAINTGGFQSGNINQITYLNGNSANQSISGVTGNLTNFANLVVQNTAPSGIVDLNTATNVRVNGSLTLQSGDVSLGANTITVAGNVSNDVNVSSAAAGFFVMGGTSAQLLGGSGLGSFQNFRVANAAGVEATSALNINGVLNFNTGILYVNNYLLTLGTTATVTGSLNAGSMIRLNGVVSDAGVKKLYPASASSFTFPIGTTLRYTPATLNLTSNSAAGSITVTPVAIAHPATTDPLNRELTAYWKVEKTGLSPAVTVNHTYQYHPNDAINGTEANYRLGRFFNNVWVPNGGIAGTVNAATDVITLNGVNYIDGDYTAGETSEFNIITTYYSRNATSGGNWTDVNSWSTDAVLQHDGAPCVTPPTNSNIIIAAGHTITCQMGDNSKTPPTTIVDGTLNLGNTFGHNFGTVTGTGTVVVTPNASNQFIFPGGNFTAFTSTGGGTFEFSSTALANLPTQATYNNLRFSGAGTKRLANTNLQVNGNITIAAGVLSNSLFNKNITLFGDWTNNVGSTGFVAGSGTSNITLAGVNQNIAGATNFYHLCVNSTGAATLNSTITVTNRLTFIQGLIATGANEVVVNAAATITGGSALSYINGNLRRILPAGVFSAQFDIGDASNYTPALVTFAGSIAANGQILARSSAGDDVNIFTSGLNENKSCNRTWTLTPTSLSGFTSVNVKLNFVAGDLDAGANALLFNAARYSGSAWTSSTNVVAQTDYLQVNGIAGLGTFQIGEPYNAIIWTGTVSSDWNTTGNWLQNRIPTFADNVVISNVANQPVLSIGANGACVDLTMNSGTTLTIGAGESLEVNGNIVANGLGISGAGTLEIKGSSASLSGGNALFNITTNIQSGATFTLTGASSAEFQKDLNVDGFLVPGSNLITFSGTQSSTLNSATEVEFGPLTINKTSNTDALILNSDIQVNGSLTLVSGDLNLGTQTADLGTTGTLVGESSLNKVFGTTGVIQAQRNLNAPASVNVAGLGAEISAPDDLGLTTIIRGTEQKSYNAAYGINRYYEIHPTNNSGLNATLVFNYFDDELVTPLGTITESTLDLWRFDGADWTRQFATLNTGTKKLTKTSIPQFSIWTAGYSSNTPLPITLLDFDASCAESNSINVTWTTASETQNKLFEIEQSNNAVQWQKIGEEPGATNSNTVLTYRGTYASRFNGASYLRLKQTDYNGQVTYFDPIYLNCGQNLGNSVSAVPNPAADYTELRFTSDADDNIEISVYSVSGQLLLRSTGSIGIGQTSIKLDLSELPAGIYYMNVSSAHGIQFGGNKTLVKR